MIKRFLIILLCCSTLMSCSHLTRLNQRAIIQAIAIDYVPASNEFNLALLAFTPEGGGGPTSIDPSQANAKIIYTSGKTQSEALKNATELQGKQLFLGDNRLVIIGHDAAKTKLREILSFFNNNPHTRTDVAFVTTVNLAQDIIQLPLSQGLTPVDVFTNLLENTKIHGKGISSKLLDVSQAEISETLSSALPVIEINQTPTLSTVTTANQDEQIEPLSKLKLNGSAVFKEGKLVGFLNESDSRGLSFIRNQLTQTVYSDTTDVITNGTFLLYKSQTKLSLSHTDPLTISIKIKPKASILEIDKVDGVEHLSDEDLQTLTAKIEKQIYYDCFAVIHKALHVYGTDLFHFGDTIWKQDPALYKTLKPNYDTILKTLKFEIDVDINLNRQGLEKVYE